MTRYEFQVVVVARSVGPQTTLNEYGAQGWSVVTGRAYDSEHDEFLLQRTLHEQRDASMDL